MADFVYKITGRYGALTTAEKEQNATAIYGYLGQFMTFEAVCGILGNIERESQLNPGQLEGGKPEASAGHGLIQWTPPSDLYVYTNKYGYQWYDGVGQCACIMAEGRNESPVGGRWLKTSAYKYTWVEFCRLTDPFEACKAYLFERERAGVSALDERLENTAKWYEFFSGKPLPPSPTPGGGGQTNRYGAARELYRRRLILR